MININKIKIGDKVTVSNNRKDIAGVTGWGEIYINMIGKTFVVDKIDYDGKMLRLKDYRAYWGEEELDYYKKSWREILE